MLILATLAHARPTEGGLFSFEDEDVVTTLDSPAATVRVWYSTEGPNQVLMDDDDANGLPDYAEQVGVEAEAVLAYYIAAGFRPTLSDEGRGGSDAMDVYLVDFAGNSDGNYAAESCSSSPRQCSGYFTMENDFAGYGYSNLDSAIRVLTSHELFHAVQAAYNADIEIWFSEGTAVWAEDLYDPENEDFIWFCDAYLTDAGRSIDQPPTGISTFSYSTALWWWFLTNRHGDDLIEALLQASETDDVLQAMSALEEERGGTLYDDFSTFASWNVATGRLSGATESYPFAAQIGPPQPEADGKNLTDDNRFYPLAATYYRLEHEGGEVWFGAEADAPELVFALHPIDAEGDIQDALAVFSPTAEPLLLGELAAGDYWLAASNPTLAEDSTKLLFCLGSLENLADCVPADTGDTAAPSPDDPEGCGCAGSRGAPWLWGMALAVAAARSRLVRRSDGGVQRA